MVNVSAGLKISSATDLPGRAAPANPCQSLAAKIFRFFEIKNQCYGLLIPPRLRGAIANVTNVGRGMRWTCMR